MNINENALKVLEKRYLKNGESPEDMILRVASTVSTDGNEYNDFYCMMEHLDFLPNSPTLMNAGKPLGQLSACFVLPVEDTMEGIFDAVKNAAIIHKSGGGTGFSFSRLRPKNSIVNSTGGVASGPVSFMKVFNAATEAVKQGGTRRGANMGLLRVDHPDILDFIKCKTDNNEINNFNISVGMTEEFMEAVNSSSDYDLIDPHSKEVVGELNAKEVFDLLVDQAWKNGEPGIVFLDRINADNPTPELGEIESTNPCGEQPLLPYEACNLGSINLSHMVENGEINWDKLKDVTEKAVRFLDNVIDVNNYPLPEIKEMVQKTRKIGLGVMGWADMLIKLGIPYNSKEALELADDVMLAIQVNAWETSYDLGEEKGAYNENVTCRNATVTTIAPTGTISMIANCSSGIEPLFAIAYMRNQADMQMFDVNPLFEKIAKERGFYSEKLIKEIAEKGSIQHIYGIPDDIKRIFVTSHDISPEYHVKMQAAFQKYTDNAVSKTVNFPNSATKDDVRKVFLLAYETGCKGVTIYRDGSRENQVLSVGTKTETPKVVGRPEILHGITKKTAIGCGNLYITVNNDPPQEIFVHSGKGGGCPSQSEATARLISLALQNNIPMDAIVYQLKGIRCHSCIRSGVGVLSCPDAIARVLNDTLKNYDIPDIQPKKIIPNTEEHLCKECGHGLEFEGGCSICKNCGFSKCG